PVAKAMVGRVLDAFGEPLDGGPAIAPEGYREIQPASINPLRRAPLDEVLETGVRAIDGVMPIAKGQRVGVFAAAIGQTLPDHTVFHFNERVLVATLNDAVVAILVSRCVGCGVGLRLALH
ncbi:hypothetical protein WHJ98_14385, partial [Staphylococcus aureus]